VRREPRSAPGIEPAAPTQRRVQSITARTDCHYEARGPRRRCRRRGSSPIRASRLLADQADERGSRSDRGSARPGRPGSDHATCRRRRRGPSSCAGQDGRARTGRGRRRSRPKARSAVRSRERSASAGSWPAAREGRRGRENLRRRRAAASSHEAASRRDAQRNMASARQTPPQGPEMAILAPPQRPGLELATRSTGQQDVAETRPARPPASATKTHPQDRSPQGGGVHSLEYPQ